MTTARERYEKKTKVVTFRVSQEMAREIAEMKTNTGLSNADLIKLGGITAAGGAGLEQSSHHRKRTALERA
jgi:hypothetical protein